MQAIHPADSFAATLARKRAAKQGSLDAFRARYAPDPTGFYDYCDLLEIKPQEGTSATGLIPFRRSWIQQRYCEERTPRDVICKPRQVWITQIELARDTWFFLTKRGVNVIIVCQSSTDHSMLNRLSERINILFASLRRNAGLVLSFASETKASWSLADGSTLQIIEAGASAAAAQKKGRGDTVHRLHTTELAFCEYAGLTLNAILEAIAGPEHGTEIVHESTANGDGGDERPASAKDTAGGPYFFWLCRDARDGRSGYAFHFFSWLQHPEYRTALIPGEVVEPSQQTHPKMREREEEAVRGGADPEQLKWYRGKLEGKGVDDTDQEYPIDPDRCFLVSGRSFFDRTVTDRLIGLCCEPLSSVAIARDGAVGTLKVWIEPSPSSSYVVSVDTSEGTGGDRGSAQVYERGTGRHCATLWGQFKPGELAAEAERLGYRYGGATIAVERNNHGAAVLLELARAGVTTPPGCTDVAAWLASLTPAQLQAATKRRYPTIFHDLDGKPGWNNVEVRRTAALDALEAAHRTGQWAPRDRAILGEVRTFVVTASGKAEGARGAHDDLVMTAMVGWDVLRRSRQNTHAPCPAPSLRNEDAALGM